MWHSFELKSDLNWNGSMISANNETPLNNGVGEYKSIHGAERLTPVSNSASEHISDPL